MIPAEQLTKLAAKSIAFQKGIEGVSDEDFSAWMENKWGLPYAPKLQTLYHDAVMKTDVLASYLQACSRFCKLDLSKVQRSQIGPSAQCIERLHAHVELLDIGLPGGGDFYPAKLIGQQPSSAAAGGKDRKALFKSQIKASVSLLKAGTALMNYLSDLAASGSRTGEYVDFRYLVTCEFFKTVKGLPDGNCHVGIYKTLHEKVTRMRARDQ